MPDDPPVVIIGAGLMGAASAWALARRGRPVLVLEQFDAGHRRGSSHGSARIVRRVYDDPLYLRLTGRAFELWTELEHASGRSILRMLGALDHGKRNLRAIADDMTELAIEHELMTAAEAALRWPGMEFEGEVLFHSQGGTLDADAAVAAFLAAAADAGAAVRHGVAATSVRQSGDSVEVACSDGSALRATCAVVAAGAWLEPLLGAQVPLPQLQVTQESVFHFPRRDPSAPPWPSTIHESAEIMYHLAGGRDGGPRDDRKIGAHHGGVPTTAAERDGAVPAAARERAVEYVRRWLPGLDPQPASETTCLYTRTASEDFVLDRVGPLVVCSPCSGHGAKFAPLVGEYVADLVTGTGAELPDRFRLHAHVP